MPGSRSASSLVAALTLAFSTMTATGTTAAAPGGEFKATVLSVGDGDTLRVNTGSRPLTIRLACIDDPETALSRDANRIGAPVFAFSRTIV
jgi:endonuclease YncB( thermonuclease family)